MFLRATQVNRQLAVLRLEGNSIDSAGAIALAQALRGNTSLRELHLGNQMSRTPFGDPCVTEYMMMLEVNLTLLKLHWRLDSRKGFAVERMLTRNNEINRRLRAGKDYAVRQAPGGDASTASASDWAECLRLAAACCGCLPRTLAGVDPAHAARQPTRLDALRARDALPAAAPERPARAGDAAGPGAPRALHAQRGPR
eukprot:scaffold1_cov402-Prasinococcus_capsulatus_cf.AAC.7